jgi:hypothetical protein
MAKYTSICRSCFHSYVCEQFNEHRECDNKKCHFANDHFAPTTDVVEVVRCKDCVYFRESDKTNRTFCTYHGDDYEFETHRNKFCSDGVKAKLKE